MVHITSMKTKKSKQTTSSIIIVVLLLLLLISLLLCLNDNYYYILLTTTCDNMRLFASLCSLVLYRYHLQRMPILSITIISSCRPIAPTFLHRPATCNVGTMSDVDVEEEDPDADLIPRVKPGAYLGAYEANDLAEVVIEIVKNKTIDLLKQWIVTVNRADKSKGPPVASVCTFELQTPLHLRVVKLVVL